MEIVPGTPLAWAVSGPVDNKYSSQCARLPNWIHAAYTQRTIPPANDEQSITEIWNSNSVVSTRPEGVGTSVQEVRINIDFGTEFFNSGAEGFKCPAIETSAKGNTEEQGEKRCDDTGDPVTRDARAPPVHHQRVASILSVPQKILRKENRMSLRLKKLPQ